MTARSPRKASAPAEPSSLLLAAAIAIVASIPDAATAYEAAGVALRRLANTLACIRPYFIDKKTGKADWGGVSDAYRTFVGMLYTSPAGTPLTLETSLGTIVLPNGGAGVSGEMKKSLQSSVRNHVTPILRGEDPTYTSPIPAAERKILFPNVTPDQKEAAKKKALSNRVQSAVKDDLDVVRKGIADAVADTKRNPHGPLQTSRMILNLLTHALPGVSVELGDLDEYTANLHSIATRAGDLYLARSADAATTPAKAPARKAPATTPAKTPVRRSPVKSTR